MCTFAAVAAAAGPNAPLHTSGLQFALSQLLLPACCCCPLAAAAAAAAIELPCALPKTWKPPRASVLDSRSRTAGQRIGHTQQHVSTMFK
jgi:hypothetical protein